MIYRYFHDQSNKLSQIELVSRTFFTQLNSSILVLVILYFFKLNSGFGIKMSESEFFFFALALFGMVFYTMCEIILRISINLNKYIILVTINSLLFLTSTFVSLYIYNFNFENYLKLFSLIYFFSGILGLFFIYPLISFKNIKYINFSYLSFALPIGLLSLSPLLQGYFMRNFVYNFLPGEMLGSYSTGYRLTIFYTLPSLALTNAILPFLVRSKNHLNFSILANKFLFFTIITMSFCLSILTLYSKDLFHIILKYNNEDIIKVFVYICLGLFIQTLSSILSIGSIIKNGTIYRFISGYLIMILAIFLSFLFIKNYGINGLICGVLIGNILQLFIDSIIAQYIFKISWDSFNIYIYISLSIFLFFVCLYFSNLSLYIRIPFTIFFLFIPFIYFNNVIFKKYK